jgi:hypothetical protein
MIERRSLRSESSLDPSKAILAGDLTKEHGDKVIPGTEAVDMIFGFCLFDGFLKFKSRKHLQHLPKYGMMMSHSPTPSLVIGYDWWSQPL